MPVSVAIIARDEADRIMPCLNSVAFADDVVVVVDARSRDDTFEIAKSRGCRVLLKEWQGYARQKQYAIEQCESDWVLILDADERIPEAAASEISRLVIDPDPKVVAYRLLRKSIFHGKWIRHCGWWPDRVVRLVHRQKGKFSDDVVHEQWLSNGAVKDLNITIEHHSFRNYADLVEKMQHYSTLSAGQMLKAGKYVGWWEPMTHGMWTFFRNWLLELGILEGFDGFMISVLNAGGSFMKYAKLREMMRHGKY